MWWVRRPAPPPPTDWAELASAAGVPASLLLAAAADGLAPHHGYHRYRKPKPAGGTRPIAEPDPRLKAIQRAILAKFLTDEPHPAAVAYRRGFCTAHHVWPHAGAEWLATADVRDFFPSTRADRVEDWWRERVDGDTARLLTTLTTLDGGLPQGAPTSPALSNLLNRPLDERLTAVADRYTRYSDDLLFSWPAAPPADVERAVQAALHADGYAMNPAKGFRLHRRTDEPAVVGVVLTRGGGVRLPPQPRPATPAAAAGWAGYVRMLKRRPR